MSQFGVCISSPSQDTTTATNYLAFQPAIGISRTKRWHRASRLGLNPPLEVLAVLVKEEEKKNKAVERAYVDELMGAKGIIGGDAV